MSITHFSLNPKKFCVQTNKVFYFRTEGVYLMMCLVGEETGAERFHPVYLE
jgi:hypothetical protein